MSLSDSKSYEDNNWSIRLEWSRGTEATVSITGRAAFREHTEELIRDIELAAELLGRAIDVRSSPDAGDRSGPEAADPARIASGMEARSGETGTGSTEGDSPTAATSGGDARNPGESA